MLTANQLVVTFSGFLFWLVAARLSTPSAVGLASTAVSSILFISMASKLGFDISLLAAIPKIRGKRGWALINTALTITTLLGLIGAAVFSLGTPVWAPDLSILATSPILFISFVLLTVTFTVGALIDTIFIARRRSDYVLFKNTLFAVSRFVILLPFIGSLSAIVIAGAAIAPMALALVIAAVFWLPRTEGPLLLRPHIDPEAAKAVLSSSFTNYLVTFALQIPASIGPLIVLNRFGPEDAAIFYVVWMIGIIGTFAPRAFGQVALVEIAHASEDRAKIGWIPMALLTLGSTVMLVLATFLVPLFGEHYTQMGLWPFLPFVLAIPPMIFHQGYTALLRARGENGRVLAITLIPVILFLVPIFTSPAPIAAMGWWWAGGLTIGAIAGRSFTQRSRQIPKPE